MEERGEAVEAPRSASASGSLSTTFSFHRTRSLRPSLTPTSPLHPPLLQRPLALLLPSALPSVSCRPKGSLAAVSHPSGRAPSRAHLYAILSFAVLLLLLSAYHSPSSIPFRTPSSALLTTRRFSTFAHDPSNLLSFRDHLELTTSPRSQIIHSPALGFGHIYVLSLPNRKDRRKQMEVLARALGVRLTFVDAADKGEPWIKWIAERVVEVRREKIKLMGQARGQDPSSFGGLDIGNDWLAQSQDTNGKMPFPPLVDSRYPSGSWTTHLEHHIAAGTLHLLRPRNPELNITDALLDPLERIPGRQVNEGVISTFFGQTKAMRMAVENGDESALILEDDVDVEWDLERLWSRIERKLPVDWEMSFLGHCWGKELLRPAYLHPQLHQSSAPLCLHAYALSKSGASHLLSLLLNPWTAYQTAVDTAVPSFILFGLLNSFSVEPPLIIQRKDGPSDIQQGIGSRWRGLLMDSTVERIARDAGEEVVEEVWDPNRLDPATTFRYRRKCGTPFRS